MKKIILISLFCCFCMSEIAIADTTPKDIGKISQKSSVGTSVPIGELEAIGTIPGCTATLIAHDLVLTAAHCVCAEGERHQCSNRATFTLHDVLPVSSQRRDISIDGDVRVHPSYDGRGIMDGKGRRSPENVDLAVIHLDTSVHQLAQVTPIPIEEPTNRPQEGDNLNLVGFGDTGHGCEDSNQEKIQMTLWINYIDRHEMVFF